MSLFDLPNQNVPARIAAFNWLGEGRSRGRWTT